MADTALPAFPPAESAELWATSNLAAFQIWDRTLYPATPLLGMKEAHDRVSGLSALGRAFARRPAEAAARVCAFAGRADVSAEIFAGLLLEADLRPDDLIWLEGAAPSWWDLALSLSEGQAPARQAAAVLVAPILPNPLWPALRRVILTGESAGEGGALIVTRAADWRCYGR